MDYGETDRNTEGKIAQRVSNRTRGLVVCLDLKKKLRMEIGEGFLKRRRYEKVGNREIPNPDKIREGEN